MISDLDTSLWNILLAGFAAGKLTWEIPEKGFVYILLDLALHQVKDTILIHMSIK